MKTNITKSIRLKLLGLSFLFVAISSASYGDTFFFNGVLSAAAGSPTAHATGQSTVGSGQQYYNVFQIAVTTSGTYTFELSSLNKNGSPSSALDTWLGIFTGTFTPPALGAPTASNDDFTGAFTVLPGPYGGSAGITATATGFQGQEPGSRLTAVSLTAGTTYYVYVSSFRDTTFVNSGTTAAAFGPYWLGFSGTGALVVTPLVQTPEPSTLALLGLGAIGALAVWRKRRAS
jgi:PEP-CTERM motif-containing protein